MSHHKDHNPNAHRHHDHSEGHAPAPKKKDSIFTSRFGVGGIVVVGLMLLGMAIYILTLDERFSPFGPAPEAPANVAE